MSFRLSDMRSREGLKLLAPFALLVVVGFLARGTYRPDWCGSDFVFALSDALAIAGLIGIGLDLYATKFLIEKVADDLTEKLVGRGLPSELQSLIREITKTAIVRENFVKVYSLGKPENGRITLDIQVSFDVRNFSDSVMPYIPEIQDESFYEPRFLYLEYGVSGKPGYVLDAAQLEAVTKTDRQTKVKSARGRESVTLRPTKESPDVCHVRWSYKVTMAEEYSEVTSFAGATRGARLILREIPDGIEFKCSGESLVHVEGSTTWDFDRPFIKEQHVRVWWHRT